MASLVVMQQHGQPQRCEHTPGTGLQGVLHGRAMHRDTACLPCTRGCPAPACCPEGTSREGRRRARARVDQAGEAHAGDVARLREDAVELPARLGGLREVVGQEAAAVLAVERAREAPLRGRGGGAAQGCTLLHCLTSSPGLAAPRRVPACMRPAVHHAQCLKARAASRATGCRAQRALSWREPKSPA